MQNKNNEKKIKAIFFDFDGVLIDSKPVMKKAWNYVCQKYSINKNFSNFEKYIGIPFNCILKNLNISNVLHKKIYYDYFRYSNKNKKLIKLNPHVREIINWSRTNNLNLAIVTSKNMKTTQSLVEFFQLNINLLITPELTFKGKPDPEPILITAKKLKINPNEVVFIGDMQTDMKCAKGAGCYYLHYKQGYENIKSHYYGGEIYSLLEIKEFIKYLNTNQ